MGALMLPRTDEERMWILGRVADPKTGGLYLQADLMAEAASRLAAYEAAYRAVPTLAGGSSEGRAQRRAAVARLAQHVRDFWAVLRRRTRRMAHEPPIFRHYGLPLSGKPPRVSQMGEWAPYAEQILAGEGHAVAAGFPPMSNPSVAEVEAALIEVQATERAVVVADTAYDQAQATLAAQREPATRLIREVLRHMRFLLAELDHPSQRRVLRLFGFKFRNDQG